MSEKRYEIDEEEKCVRIGTIEELDRRRAGYAVHGASLPFSHIAECHDKIRTDRSICCTDHIELYLIARDELIERGLIEDIS